MRYDIESIADLIAALGGPSSIGDWLGITQEAVSNWKARDCIPPGWHLKLLVALNRRGLTVNPNLFDIDADDMPFLSAAVA
jgi:hypothetical protein